MNNAERLYFVRLIQESSRPLEPLPVSVSPEWVPAEPPPVPDRIQAVLFDLYGTLFISAAGEITTGVTIGSSNVHGDMNADERKDTPQSYHTKAQRHKEKQLVTKSRLGALVPPCDEMKKYFRKEVQRRHETAQAAGIAWPEVRVEEIWAGYRGKFPSGWELPEKMQQLLDKIGPRAAARSAGRELALRYELAVNPVYPMPFAKETICSLVSSGKTLGIISNAQFFSPLLFDAFFDSSPPAMGFDPELCIYSFVEKEAKPSLRLFVKARELLARRNIKPEETLYVGNDMRNDIIPAAAAGFVTALFAGDRRSLRLREDDPDCTGKKPGMVIKELLSLIH